MPPIPKETAGNPGTPPEDDAGSAGTAGMDIDSAFESSADTSQATATPEASAAAAQQASPPPSWRDRLGERGYDTSSFESDDDVFNALLTTAEEFHQHQPLIQRGREYLTHEEQFQEWLRQQEAAKGGAGQGNQQGSQQGSPQPQAAAGQQNLKSPLSSGPRPNSTRNTCDS